MARILRKGEREKGSKKEESEKAKMVRKGERKKSKKEESEKAKMARKGERKKSETGGK